MILVQRRQRTPDLDEVVGRGTKTSRFWVERWFCLEKDQEHIKTNPDARGASMLRACNEYHCRWLTKCRAHDGCSHVIPEWEITKDKEINTCKASERFAHVQGVIRAAGAVGSILFKDTTWTSRKGNAQKALQLLPIDIFLYDVIFADEQVFGSKASCTYTHFDQYFGESSTCDPYITAQEHHHDELRESNFSCKVPNMVNLTGLQEDADVLAVDLALNAATHTKLCAWMGRNENQGWLIVIRLTNCSLS